MRTFASIILLNIPAFACSCRSLSFDEIVERPTLFVGEVIDGGIASIRDDPWHSPVTRVRFRVLERFRGVPKDTESIDLAVMPTNGMCSPNPYYSGRRYLVMPGVLQGSLFDGMCFTGQDLQESGSLVDDVRRYFVGILPATIRGRVAVARDADMVGFLLEQGEAKPLAGVRISTSGSGRTYRATTDSEGRYVLPVPKGRYQLQVSLPPYSFEENIRVAVNGAGAERDIAARIDTSICGRVWDERGQPLKSVVGLIDSERRFDGRRSDAFQHAYTNDAGSYCFAQVPLGRYLIVFNPEGPRSGGLFDLTRERTYYPLSSPRGKAEAVVIDAAGTHRKGVDLVAGATVKLRDVGVTVSFPDGTPMNHAYVRCIGEPRSDAEAEWKDGSAALGGGQVQFRAPADRKLRIQVTDWYGRDLKTKYESVHEAGIAPIAQKFVVTP